MAANGALPGSTANGSGKVPAGYYSAEQVYQGLRLALGQIHSPQVVNKALKGFVKGISAAPGLDPLDPQFQAFVQQEEANPPSGVKGASSPRQGRKRALKPKNDKDTAVDGQGTPSSLTAAPPVPPAQTPSTPKDSKAPSRPTPLPLLSPPKTSQSQKATGAVSQASTPLVPGTTPPKTEGDAQEVTVKGLAVATTAAFLKARDGPVDDKAAKKKATSHWKALSSEVRHALGEVYGALVEDWNRQGKKGGATLLEAVSSFEKLKGIRVPLGKQVVEGTPVTPKPLEETGGQEGPVEDGNTPGGEETKRKKKKKKQREVVEEERQDPGGEEPVRKKKKKKEREVGGG